MHKAYNLVLDNGEIRETTQKFTKTQMSENKSTVKTTDDVFKAEPSKNAVKKDLKTMFNQQPVKATQNTAVTQSVKFETN